RARVRLVQNAYAPRRPVRRVDLDVDRASRVDAPDLRPVGEAEGARDPADEPRRIGAAAVRVGLVERLARDLDVLAPRVEERVAPRLDLVDPRPSALGRGCGFDRGRRRLLRIVAGAFGERLLA